MHMQKIGKLGRHMHKMNMWGGGGTWPASSLVRDATNVKKCHTFQTKQILATVQAVNTCDTDALYTAG